MISKWPKVWEESSSLQRNKQNGKLEGFQFPNAHLQADPCSAVDSSQRNYSFTLSEWIAAERPVRAS